MSVAVVQVYSTVPVGNNVTPFSGSPFSASVTAGSTIVVAIDWGGSSGSVLRVTDNLNASAYTPVPGSFVQPSGKPSIQWFYLANSLGGALTITVSMSSGQPNVLFEAYEISGLGTAPAPAGVLTTSYASGTTPTVGPLVTTTPVSLLLVAWRGQATSGSSGGFTMTGIGGSSPSGYLITTTSGSYTAGVTQTSGAGSASLVSFDLLPKLTTASTVTIAPNSMTLTSTLTATGGGTITDEGFNWGLTGAYGNTVHVTPGGGAETFTKTLTSLTPSTLYHFQAFATNATGTTSGPDSTATTLATEPSNVRSVLQSYTTPILASGLNPFSGAPFGSNVTSGSCILVCVAWASGSGSVTSVTDNLNAGNYTPIPGSQVQGQGRTLQWFFKDPSAAGALTITVTTNEIQTNELFQAYEISGVGVPVVVDSVATQLNTGSNFSTTITGTDPNDIFFFSWRGPVSSAINGGWTAVGVGTNSVSAYQIGSGAGNYTATITQASGTSNATMVALKAFTNFPLLSITQGSQIGLSQTGVTLLGQVLSNSAFLVSAEGFHWGLTNAYGNTVTLGAGGEAESFSAPVTGLSPGTTYHYRAWATNVNGTGVSFDGTFVTPTVATPNKGEVLYAGGHIFSGVTTYGSPDNLFDGNNFTGWHSSTFGAWAGMDLTTPASLTRLRYTSWSGYEDYFAGARLQGSNDLLAWTTLYTWANAFRPLSGTLNNEILLNGVSPFRYYRVLSNPATQWVWYDLDFIGAYQTGVVAQAVTPIISPPGGNFDLPINVRISSLTIDAAIYYTLDGTTPTTSSTLYTGPFQVSSSTQVNAIAVSPGMYQSRVVTSYFYVPGIFFAHTLRYDDRNYKLCINEGCIFHDPISGYWYEYILNKDFNDDVYVGHLGQNVYRSTDLRNWTFAGSICQMQPGLANGGGPHQSMGVSRAMVFYCKVTQLYTIWITNGGAFTPVVTVWTSPYPDGRQPWTKFHDYTAASPFADGFVTSGMTTVTYGDKGQFTDDDGKIYLIYNYNANTTVAISQLDPNTLTNTLGPGVNSASYAHGATMEGWYMFKRKGVYFIAHSGQAGAPNFHNYTTSYVAYSLTGPLGPYTNFLTNQQNPFVNVVGTGFPSSSLAYNSQGGQVIKIPGRDDGTGYGAYFYIGDDNNPDDEPANRFGNKVMIPMSWASDTAPRMTWQPGYWFDGVTADSPWSIDLFYPSVPGGPPRPASSLNIVSGVATWQNNDPNPVSIYLDASNDPTFSTGVFSEALAQGSTSFTIQVPAAFYRIRTVNVSGTSFATPSPPIVPFQYGNAFTITPASSKNIQYLQVVQSGTVVSGNVSSVPQGLNNVAAQDILVARVSWQSNSGGSSVSDTLNGAYTSIPGSQQSFYNMTVQWFYVVSSAGSPVITASLSSAQPGVIFEVTELIPWETYIPVPGQGPGQALTYYPGGPQWNNLNIIQNYIDKFNEQGIYLTLPHPTVHP